MVMFELCSLIIKRYIYTKFLQGALCVHDGASSGAYAENQQRKQIIRFFV